MAGEGGNDGLVGDEIVPPPAVPPLGNDTLLGGPGDDFATGQRGDDRVSGGSGDDDLFGGPGIDFVTGDDGHDIIFGNFGSDTLSGGSGDDFINGDNPQADSIGPEIDPSPHIDRCFGGPGLDTIVNCESSVRPANQEARPRHRKRGSSSLGVLLGWAARPATRGRGDQPAFVPGLQDPRIGSHAAPGSRAPQKSRRNRSFRERKRATVRHIDQFDGAGISRYSVANRTDVC